MSDTTKNNPTTRKIHMNMSNELVDFYQEMADSMGIPRSTAMIIALKTYMDQQNMLKITNQLPKY